MAKAKKGSKENPITEQEMEEILTEVNSRDYKIIGAVVKDDLCDYAYEITRGVGFGDKHKVEGKGIVTDDLLNALSKLRVHLAIADDAFKRSSIEIDDIDKFHGHDITGYYFITGIKIKGSGDNESVVIVGNKYCQSVGGRMELVAPRISMDTLGGYKWYNELKEAVDRIREEVALYKEGKVKIHDDEDDKPGKRKRNAIQLTIASPEAVAGSEPDNSEDEHSTENNDADFEDAVV